MAKIPKWKRDFNRRMAQQLRDFAKSKGKRLTEFSYTNGQMVTRQVYQHGRGRRRGKYVNVTRWIPNSTTSQPPS